jgi:hypothetical protein
MSGGISEYLALSLLDQVFGYANSGAGFAPTANALYIGLFSTNPVNGVVGTELSGSNYARVTTNASTGTGGWTVTNAASASTPVTVTNINTVVFPNATANWTAAVGFGVFDATSAGHMLAWGPITSTVVGSGNIASFGAGALVLTLV